VLPPNYRRGDISISQRPRIDTCNCWHGRFISDYYGFNSVYVDRFFKRDDGSIAIVRDGVECDLSQILEDWIRSRRSGKRIC